MSSDTREAIRDLYSQGSEEYDRVRLEDPKGRLLSDHDVWLFGQMFPPYELGMKVLEIGAGTGRFTLPALERGVQMVATDINQEMLRLLQQKLQERGFADRCTVRVDDIFHLSFGDAEFDLVFSLHVIPRFLTLEDQTAALRELARVIRPKGKLLFNYRNIRSPYGLLYKGHGTTPAQIDQVLRESGMKIADERGKWLLNKKLVSKLPLIAGRSIAAFDRATARVHPRRAWDVFVLAEKL